MKVVNKLERIPLGVSRVIFTLDALKILQWNNSRRDKRGMVRNNNNVSGWTNRTAKYLCWRVDTGNLDVGLLVNQRRNLGCTVSEIYIRDD